MGSNGECRPARRSPTSVPAEVYTGIPTDTNLSERVAAAFAGLDKSLRRASWPS
ncbi:hypothetical protein ACFQ0G_44675 [Streptomyces chiangmaiensis]